MARRKKRTHPLLGLAILGDICKTDGLLTLFPHSHPQLWSIQEPGIQTLLRWLLRGISLPSSRSASFTKKVIFLVSTPHVSDSLACPAASRVSLDSVMVWMYSRLFSKSLLIVIWAGSSRFTFISSYCAAANHSAHLSSCTVMAPHAGKLPSSASAGRGTGAVIILMDVVK